MSGVFLGEADDSSEEDTSREDTDEDLNEDSNEDSNGIDEDYPISLPLILYKTL